MDRPGVRQVPEGSGEQGKMEETGCEIICGAPKTLLVKGLMPHGRLLRKVRFFRKDLRRTEDLELGVKEENQ